MATVKGNSSTTLSLNRSATTGSKEIATKINPSRSQNWANGTAADQIEEIYQAVYTAQASPQTIDLTALTDDDGAAFAFEYIKEICILNDDTSGTLTVGAAGANPFKGALLVGATDTAKVLPKTSGGASGMLHWVSPGVGVLVSGTNKNILMTPSVSMAWKIIIAGTRV